jgi:hypothetical protein
MTSLRWYWADIWIIYMPKSRYGHRDLPHAVCIAKLPIAICHIQLSTACTNYRKILLTIWSLRSLVALLHLTLVFFCSWSVCTITFANCDCGSVT